MTSNRLALLVAILLSVAGVASAADQVRTREEVFQSAIDLAGDRFIAYST